MNIFKVTKLIILLPFLFCIQGCKISTKKTGKIILIAGTSSAGKSSIIDELKKVYGNTYKIINIDDFDFDALKLTEQKAKELGWDSDKTNLNDFMDDYVLKKGQNPGINSDLYKEIQELKMNAFFDYIKNISIKEKNIIVDTVFENVSDYDRFLNVMHDQNIVKILVYSPLEVIAQRVELRNKTGKKEEQRTVFQALMQFPAFYKVQDFKNEPVIDVMKNNDTKQFLKKAADDYIKLLQPDTSQTKVTQLATELDKFSQIFIKQFKLDEKEEVGLVPTRPYDLIVNSSIDTPDLIAKKINFL